jgi:hypothetical protein
MAGHDNGLRAISYNHNCNCNYNGGWGWGLQWAGGWWLAWAVAGTACGHPARRPTRSAPLRLTAPLFIAPFMYMCSGTEQRAVALTQAAASGCNPIGLALAWCLVGGPDLRSDI